MKVDCTGKTMRAPGILDPSLLKSRSASLEDDPVLFKKINIISVKAIGKAEKSPELARGSIQSNICQVTIVGPECHPGLQTKIGGDHWQ